MYRFALYYLRMAITRNILITSKENDVRLDNLKIIKIYKSNNKIISWSLAANMEYGKQKIYRKKQKQMF